ncbi:type IX secretion system motor protein PorM/GldM [Flavobacterium subsaxonicum]|uniref:Gliding motility protein GldM n=1 Tax=Flavobacterium subsaxonicum WB 4.1-42 = DSM 21790 TaxID=1121898 RepID=A0A0A2MS35_9FLAO|nr:gliding motility protein GldM [Flavobacterium subsaxonicum]KGO94248.1 gliding motility protein GldM [Flavobacterium subsaxonicum WB 4.1-42 = DSM 21790]
MAGGKLTPRQKMINLMYLVFIAMLALNMSKEVLSAFGLMNEQFEESNKNATVSNKTLYDGLAAKAGESGGEFAAAKVIADKVKATTAGFTAYIESLKGDITKDIEREEGKLPYEAMDKGDKIDEGWFAGDGYSAKGNEIIATIEKYKSDIKTAVGNNPKYKSIISEVDSKFSTADVKDGEGVTKKYLDYHYKGFPSIASLTKLSALQNSANVIETNVYNAALGNAAISTASMSKYTAIVVLDKNAYFQGEQVTGKVVLGRYDPDTKPTSFKGPGKLENGQAIINMTAGGIGEQNINGEFTFLEDGKTIPLKFEGKYVVVPRPNEATISADKMNSVYRGVDNPMTISFAGISDNAVTANASGGSFRKGSKPGQYNWNVSSASGTTAVVNVTGKMSDGKSVTSKKTFNVRPIPAPVPSLRGKAGSGKGNKNDLSSSTIAIAFPDFVFDVQTSVKSFEVYVPGSPAMIVNGNRFDSKALAAIAKTRRGDVVTINNVEFDLVGAGGYKPPRSSSFAWEVQ